MWGDSPLLSSCEYEAPLGGRVVAARSKDLRNVAVSIAHRDTLPDGTECTIHDKVTAEDHFGLEREAVHHARQRIWMKNYPPGATNGGPRTICSKTVLQLLVNR